MQTNLLKAVKNIVNNPVLDLVSFYSSTNRMNGMGESLEMYIKDIFCGSLDVQDLAEKNRIFSAHFSYMGNDTNPPDIIIRGGDAIEVKKIETINTDIALNSSYPKDKLYANSPMITTNCRNCEDWVEKDCLYTIGLVKEARLKSLWFVYGDCYAANKETYERIRTKISVGLKELPDIELAETNELGRLNRIDPLGITYLRIRGMWGINNPNKVFSYLTSQAQADFTLNVLLLKNKYDSFPQEDRVALENIVNEKFTITDVQIKSPNNPAVLLEAKLISFIK
jgi:hypothetical protein